MEHTRSGIKKLIPVVGDSLLTNKRRPILTVTEVRLTSPTFGPACTQHSLVGLALPGAILPNVSVNPYILPKTLIPSYGRVAETLGRLALWPHMS